VYVVKGLTLPLSFALGKGVAFQSLGLGIVLLGEFILLGGVTPLEGEAITGISDVFIVGQVRGLVELLEPCDACAFGAITHNNVIAMHTTIILANVFFILFSSSLLLCNRFT
jgi:hypothetical protein